ncbi:T9SS type A sorting domain-containing protein [Ulvibacter antarcticus]|uniref:Putative secreted protein (Por secretion system target) n=1 Tax=Ulvibacter antarcticus TaxID=442714 RepID=A0A3L9Y8L2_9FLAO|nr:T9SS type A sorting domain-containing protein [Ulvibacter antarcticus]RMA57036.1 putative secreted protein (Por secretion system target) [Ulvibacter antarcticus]
MKNLKKLLIICTLMASVHSISQIRYYASNRTLNAVNTYQEDGSFIEEFIAQNEGGLSNPQDILLHPEGFYLITGSDNPQIKKFDIETGAYLGDWSDPAFNLGRPSKMSIGPDNLLYVTQWGTTAATAKIVRFDMAGNYLGPFTPIAPTGMGHVWDAGGNFYLAVFGVNTGVGTVKKYDLEGNFIEDFIDSTILENPTYIWWDNNGDMLVQDYTQGKVLRYDSEGNYLEDYITGLNNPEGYTFLPNGNLLISERGANLVSEFDPSGNFIGRWDNGGTLEGPNFIEAIDVSILSTADHQITSTIVTPSVGTLFTLNIEISQNITDLQVFDLNGRRIDNIDLQQSHSWNATNLNEGVYFILATTSEDKKLTQKIIVKK